MILMDKEESEKTEPGMFHKTRTWVIIVAILVVGLAWTRGTFDNFLWRVHLNYNDCAQNGFGATFCGNDLKQYKQRIGQ